MTIIIGLIGPAGAGKSSVAQYLIEKYAAVRYSFAGPLKEFAQNALGFSHEQCWGTQAQKEAPDERYGGHSARWFLQRLGTEGGRRTFGEDFWTKMLMAKISREAPALAVIDDARFVNEAQAIRNGFVTERRMLGTVDEREHVQSPGYIWTLNSPERETAEAESQHASEQEWKKVDPDFLIQPLQRGLPQLFALVDDACRHFKLFPKRPEMRL